MVTPELDVDDFLKKYPSSKGSSWLDGYRRELYEEIAKIEDAKKRLEVRERFERTLAAYDGDDKIITSEKAAEQIAEERKRNELKIYSEFPTLDGIIDGYRLGSLNIISAPTGAGKTTLCQNLTQNFAHQGIMSTWFSYEVPMSELLEKFTEQVVFTLPQQLKGNTTQWIEKKIVEAKVKYDAKVIFIDHLHYLIDLGTLGKNVNMSLAIGHTLRALKVISVRWNVAIFLVAHLTKTKFDKPPELADLRDSSFIAQEADTVLLMYRPTKESEYGFEYLDEVRLSVQKNRRTGKLGALKLIYQDHKLTELHEETI